MGCLSAQSTRKAGACFDGLESVQISLLRPESETGQLLCLAEENNVFFLSCVWNSSPSCTMVVE